MIYKIIMNLLLLSLSTILSGCGSESETSNLKYRSEVSNKEQTIFEAKDFVVISPVPNDIASIYNLDLSYYKKYINVWGFPILSSEKIDDVILQNAAELIAKSLSDDAIYNASTVRDVMYRNFFRVVIFPGGYNSDDVPEHSSYNLNALGLGAVKGNPIMSSTEEALSYNASLNHNLSNYSGITIFHELTHSIHHLYLKDIDSTFDSRLSSEYTNAVSTNKWPNDSYITNSFEEYLAVGSELWFNRNEATLRVEDQTLASKDYTQNLNEYLYYNDPGLYDLVSEIYIDGGINNTKLSFQKGHNYINFNIELSSFDGDSAEKANVDNYEVQIMTDGELNDFTYISPESIFSDSLKTQFYQLYVSPNGNYPNINGYIEIPNVEHEVDGRYVFHNYHMKIKFKGEDIFSCKTSRDKILSELEDDSSFEFSACDQN